MDDPYLLLGVTKNSTEYEVKAAYRCILRNIHPDKNKKSMINLTDVERGEIIKRVKRAYKQIIKETADVPDYDIKYDLGEYDTTGTQDFDISAFNEQFEKTKMDSPWDRGYNEFDLNKGIREETPQKIKIPKPQKQRLVKYQPQVVDNDVGYRLGLSTVGDFGSKIGSKNSIQGSDLGMVHQNMEYWENSASAIKDKFNTDKPITELYNKQRLERENVKIDIDMQKKHQRDLNLKNMLEYREIRNNLGRLNLE